MASTPALAKLNFMNASQRHCSLLVTIWSNDPSFIRLQSEILPIGIYLPLTALARLSKIASFSIRSLMCKRSLL